nr:hypothetical protein BaRGS_019024 [Batillaria attramentaria]
MFPPRQRFQHPTSDGQPQQSSTVRSTVEKVYTSTIDPDVTQMETMLDQWCLELKRNVLAEFGQSKTRVVTNCREEVMRETEKFASDKTDLVEEMDTMKELLHTYEQSAERKDSVISNLTTALHHHRDKMELMRKFCDWKAQHNDAKRESFASNLARKHYERTLSRRVLSAWFSTIQTKWRQHVEKACQMKAQEVCLQLTADYEAKIASLNEALESSRKEVQRLHVDREHYEEAMKKAFMRGVCALNMEAMNMFQEDGDNDPKPTDRSVSEQNVNFSNNMNDGVPHKVIGAAKAMPQDSDEPSVKIVTSQGSRSTEIMYIGKCRAAQVSYINSRKSVNQGRRIPKEKNKTYPRELDPRDMKMRGRIRVQLKKEDGTPMMDQFPTN